MKKFLKYIAKSYHNLRLQKKLTITHLVIVSIPVAVLLIFFYGKLYDMIVADTIRTEQLASSRTAPLIEETVNSVLDTSRSLQGLEFYQDIFNTNRQGSLDALSVSTLAEKFNQETKSLIDGSLITDIRIYLDLPRSQKIFTSKYTKDRVLPIREAKGTYWYGIFKGEASASALYCPSFYLSKYEIQNYGELAYITRSYVTFEGSIYPCFTAVYYSQEPLAGLLKDNLTSTDSVAYLINDRNSIVATSSQALSGTYPFDYDTVRDSFMSSNNFILKNVLGQDVYAGFYNIRKADWFMVVVMPSQPMIKKSYLVMGALLGVYLICIIISLLIATLLSHSITNRISSVILQMTKVRTGPPMAMPASESHDEIGDLIDTYNYMTRMMNQLMDDQAKAAEDLRIAEFDSLQAQINPHFLYNTMDMINWLAQQGRTQEVTQAIQDLSRFYKLTLSRKENISTIADEVEHVSIYVRLQNMRYHDIIDFVVDIPDELLEYRMPKLTFQPVVENAILHGILEKDEKRGTIVLTGWMEEKAIVLLVSDDGVGIDPEKLPKILSGEGTSKTGSNIAIYNTHRRLQILYGQEYGLSYSSTPGKGTDVEIRLPAENEDAGVRLPAGPSAAPAASLITIGKKQDASPGTDTVSPLALLRYNKKLARDAFEIRNLHEISNKLHGDENIYLLAHKITEDFPPHSHQYYEMNYVCQGSVINIVDSRELYMSAGDLIVLSPKAVHALKCCQPDTLLLNFCLRQPLFDTTFKTFYQARNPLSDFLRGVSAGGDEFLFYSLAHSLKAQTIVSSVIQTYSQSGFKQTHSLEGLLLCLLDHLAREEACSYYGIDSKTLQLLQYIRGNCLRSSLGEIAAKLGYSETRLRDLIKKHVGRAPEDIIQEVRLNHALQLLAKPELSIYQIGETCGYANPRNFALEFREQFGISPEEYRKQLL